MWISKILIQFWNSCDSKSAIFFWCINAWQMIFSKIVYSGSNLKNFVLIDSDFIKDNIIITFYKSRILMINVRYITVHREISPAVKIWLNSVWRSNFIGKCNHHFYVGRFIIVAFMGLHGSVKNWRKFEERC